MTRSFFWALVAMFLGCGFLSLNTFAQGALDKTDFGKSQNTTRDLANSLTPGQERVGKGEKKSEVDPRTLQSKAVKDTTFSGNLNDIGLDWGGEKMGKLHGGDAEAKPVKQGESAGKDSKASNHTDSSHDKEKASKSGEASSDVQKKEEKTSTGSEEKAGKPDGNH